MNANAKHTPGPWKMKKDRFSQSVWAGNDRIAEMMGWGKQRRRANARLIAAAPALLEALRFCLEIMEEQAGDEHFIDCPGTAEMNGGKMTCPICEARAAIAQAEGGAQ